MSYHKINEDLCLFGKCYRIFLLKEMADVNSLFDCFDETAPNEASVQFPNIKKEEDES